MVRKIVKPTTRAGRRKYKRKSWKWSYPKRKYKKGWKKRARAKLKKLTGKEPVYREGALRSPDGYYWVLKGTDKIHYIKK